MAEDVPNAQAKVSKPLAASAAPAAGEDEHYEEVAEYRIGEGPPPLPLVIVFALIVMWATISWIPFFGY